MKRFSIIISIALVCGFLSQANAINWDGLNDSGPEVTLPEIKADVAPSPDPAYRPAALRRLIAVDPGHPNTFNSGLADISGTNETRLNWQVAVKLERILKEKGFDVLMTKSSELQPVQNKDRARMANNAGAALTVHLHCDSAPTTGFAIYYPDREGVNDYKDDPENGFRGPSLQVRAASRALADAMQKGMKEILAGSLSPRGVFGDSRTLVGSRQGALTTSIFSTIPTITIEMAVMNNKHDLAFIRSDEGQEKMAQAIAAGILLY